MTLDEIEYREKLKRLSFTVIRKCYDHVWDEYCPNRYQLSKDKRDICYVDNISPVLCKSLRESLGIEHSTAFLFALEYYESYERKNKLL